MMTTVNVQKSSRFSSRQGQAYTVPAPHRGDIYWVLNQNAGANEMWKNRPAVIISSEYINKRNNLVTVAWITSNLDKTPLDTHCDIKTNEMATALCEHVNTVSVERLGDYIRTVTDGEMDAIDKCVRIALGLDNNEVAEPVNVTDGAEEILRDMMQNIDDLYFAEKDEKIAVGIERAYAVARRMLKNLLR